MRRWGPGGCGQGRGLCVHRHVALLMLTILKFLERWRKGQLKRLRNCVCASYLVGNQIYRWWGGTWRWYRLSRGGRRWRRLKSLVTRSPMVDHWIGHGRRTWLHYWLTYGAQWFSQIGAKRVMNERLSWRFSLPPFCATILKPNLDSRLAQIETQCELFPCKHIRIWCPDKCLL